MKIVILTAGIGPKFGNPFPKPLTSLFNGRSIMDMQVSNLDNSFNIHDISAMVGFKKQPTTEKSPESTYIYNPFFDQTNISKSLLGTSKKNRENANNVFQK